MFELREIIYMEIKYNISYLLSLITVIAIFTVFAVNNISPFDQQNFVTQYFWSGIIGILLFVIFVLIFLRREKENRVRQFLLLPVEKKKVLQARLVFAAVILYSILAYFLILRNFTNDYWDVQIEGILRQFSMFITFLAILAILVDTRSFFPRLPLSLYNLLVLLFVLTVVSIQIIILSNWPGKSGIENFGYLSWGFLFGGAELFQEFKKSYL